MTLISNPDMRVKLTCSNCDWNETRQAGWDRRKSVYIESEKAKEWHEAIRSHRVIWTATEVTDPETLDEFAKQEQREAESEFLRQKHLASTGARIQILELPIEQGGDLGDDTRSRFSVIVDRAPTHLVESQAFQDAMKDFARDSGGETAFVTSEAVEIAEL